MLSSFESPVHTQLSHASFVAMTTSWPPFHVKTSLVPTSTVISLKGWGMALQKFVRLTPIHREVDAAASSAALVPRSEELLSAPATIAASISIVGCPSNDLDTILSGVPAACCSLQVRSKSGGGLKGPCRWKHICWRK